jgi:hypothetical protein
MEKKLDFGIFFPSPLSLAVFSFTFTSVQMRKDCCAWQDAGLFFFSSFFFI